MPRLATLYIIVALLLVASACLSARAWDSGHGPTLATAQRFSAGDFDWRDMLPALAAAAEMPADEGVKELFENSAVLRSYFAGQLRAECLSDKSRCAPLADSSGLEHEITSRIDGIVAKGLFTRHKTEIVDYAFARKPFPFSEIAAYKSQNQHDAYFMLALSDHSYKSWTLQRKYGAPFDDDIFQWYGVYKYRLDTADYRSEAVFEMDPSDGAVLKIAVSFKPKKHRHGAEKPGPTY